MTQSIGSLYFCILLNTLLFENKLVQHASGFISPLHWSRILSHSTYLDTISHDTINIIPTINKFQSQAAQTYENASEWSAYLIEFRGGILCSSLRIDEVRDAASCYMKRDYVDQLIFEKVLSDTISSVPICVSVKLPSAVIAKQIAGRCATIRSISLLCGSGDTPEEVAASAYDNFHSIMLPLLLPTANNLANSWKFHFRRYGRNGHSGRDHPERTEFMKIFVNFLRSIGGPVDLTNPVHNFLYLEDWNNFSDAHDRIQVVMNQLGDINVDNNFYRNENVLNRLQSSDVPSELLHPAKSYLCYLLSDGPTVYNDFSLKTRPFIGTTTMEPLSAHLSANAAQVLPGQIILDPFCGTGSLSLACAQFGGYVIASDIDYDSLGLLPQSPPPLPSNSVEITPFTNTSTMNCVTPLSTTATTSITAQQSLDNNGTNSKSIKEFTSTSTTSHILRKRSKNNRFRRKGDVEQVDVNFLTNFEYYNLSDKLLARLAIDVKYWLQSDLNITWESTDNNTFNHSKDDFLQFDAIVTDPPFGRREKAVSESMTSAQSMGDPLATISILFAVAGYRLKTGGRLVFWFPASPAETEAQVTSTLLQQRKLAGSLAETSCLVLERIRCQNLHSDLSRWLCVFEKI